VPMAAASSEHAAESTEVLRQKLARAEKQNSQLATELDLAVAEAIMSQQALEECVQATTEGTSVRPAFRAQFAKPSPGEPARLAEALLSSNFALEAALMEHDRTSLRLEQAVYANQVRASPPLGEEMAALEAAHERERTEMAETAEMLRSELAELGLNGNAKSPERSRCYSTPATIIRAGAPRTGDSVSWRAALGTADPSGSLPAGAPIEERLHAMQEAAGATSEFLHQEVSELQAEWGAHTERAEGEIADVRALLRIVACQLANDEAAAASTS